LDDVPKGGHYRLLFDKERTKKGKETKEHITKKWSLGRRHASGTNTFASNLIGGCGKNDSGISHSYYILHEKR